MVVGHTHVLSLQMWLRLRLNPAANPVVLMWPWALFIHLYRIEDKVVELKLSPGDIYKIRQEESKPILDKFLEWLNKLA